MMIIAKSLLYNKIKGKGRGSTSTQKKEMSGSE